MILHAIELTHVGRFRETVRLGPLSPGLNVLAAPNESGKSTALQAVARALFDRHTTRGEEIKALQPAGTALAPRVAVEFETREGRFRVAKTFLQRPESRLDRWGSGRWELVAEADAADQRVQQLLRSSLPGRGATKPEHWGFLGFLWARQGEPAAWPGLDDAEIGQRIRARLARVELDPVIEALRGRLGAAAEAVITSTGQPRAGGALRAAEDELAALDAELDRIRRTRAELEDTHRRFEQAEAEVDRLEKEQAARAAAASALREQATAAERLGAELSGHRQALGTARERLNALAADAATLDRLRREQGEAASGLGRARETAAAAVRSHADLRARLDAAAASLPGRETALQSLRLAHQRLQSLLKLRRQSAEAEGLARQLARAEAAAREVADLGAKRAALPDLAPARVRRLEEQADAVRTGRAQLEALGLTVELTPEKESTVGIAADPEAPARVLPAGATHRLQSPSALDLRLGGWGRVVIRSGSQDAQAAAADLARVEAALAAALDEAGVGSLEAAREVVATCKELDLQIRAARAVLAPLLGEHGTSDELRAATVAAARRVEVLVAALVPTVDEQGATLTHLEAEEVLRAGEVSAAEASLGAFHRELEGLRADERAAGEAARLAEMAVSDRELSLRVLEAQIRDLGERHPGGIEAAKAAAQMAFVECEARVAATERQLPTEFEKLPERNRRAVASLQQIETELGNRRTERDQARGTLGTLGGQGLYSRETELEERRAGVILRRDAARELGWCARVAHDLIEHRKQAATRAVLTPLEERLTAAFAGLTGDSGRRVFLDDRLQIAGIGRSRDEVHAFDQLSQGAKEQLLLCLRLSVAQELAADEPQVLILDDVLVNTDPARQERVLDVLAAEAVRLQILILTCHADRYRGVGEAVMLSGQL